MPVDALDVFVSYSLEDESLWRELEERLVRLGEEGLIGACHSRRIAIGEEWRGWTDRDLLSADMILLIVSAPLLESGYGQSAEIRHALEQHAWGRARLVPIIARPCDWSSAPFAGLATLPQEVGPVTEWHSREDAWEDVAQGLHDVAHQLIRARFEDTAAYRRAVLAPPREEEPDAAEPAEELPESGVPRWAIAGGLIMVLAVLAAVLYFAVWQPRRPEAGAPRAPAAEVGPSLAEPGQEAAAAVRARSAAAAPVARPVAPPSPATPREAEPEAAESPAPPEASPVPEMPEELTPAAEADVEPAGAAEAPAAEPRPPRDFERSLGILASPGAETEGECLAVLVAGDAALTSRACGKASGVVVMGGNALTATRDEIFDLDPRETPQATEVHVVRLLQSLGDTWGFAATRLDESFEYPSLTAHYVEEAAILRARCVAEASLAEVDGGVRAYVENVTFDRYAGFVEEAAAEAISAAGADWASLLSEVLEAGEERLAGFVCDFAFPPAGNLVLSEGGRAVGIGYPCEPFDRLEAEVRDNLPPELRELDLDCIATLAELRREHLPGEPPP